MPRFEDCGAGVSRLWLDCAGEMRGSEGCLHFSSLLMPNILDAGSAITLTASDNACDVSYRLHFVVVGKRRHAK